MAGRGLSRDQLDAIAQGRVWTGKDAQKIGLVDVLGGMEDAIRIAARKANIEEYDIVEYPKLKNPIEAFFTDLTGNVKSRLMKEELGAFYPTWQQLKNTIRNQGILARIPYDIVYN